MPGLWRAGPGRLFGSLLEGLPIATRIIVMAGYHL